MKFNVCIKDPDVFSDAVSDAVNKEVSALNLPSDEAEAVVERREEKVNDFLNRWVKYGEYITVEFDTDANTASVVPRK